MKWLMQLSNAIEYIENNLTGEISYNEAAKIACCSTYYFQRMFSYVAGISLSEYIRRRKMTQAAFELQSPDSKVLDTAHKYGYASPTSFNRAFQNIHRMPPAAAKKRGNILNAYPPIKFSVNMTGGSSMPYRIESKEAMRIVGIRVPLVEDTEENQRIVPEFWNEMFKSNKVSDVCNLQNKDLHGILGVTVYENPRDIYYYIAAVTDVPVPPNMYECTIPAATWVIFESDGHFKESVQTVFKRFLTEWLPFSGYEYAMLPDIEVYPLNENQVSQGHSEVWIAIKTGRRD